MADDEQPIQPAADGDADEVPAQEAAGEVEPAVGENPAPPVAPATPLAALTQMTQGMEQPPAQAYYGPRVYGRRYGFLCGYCSSRLEATDNMAGQSGTCPTCGNAIVIPILDNRGRLIDPMTNEIIKQDPHPVHAYAAAGHRAPAIVPTGKGDERAIQCPRCQRLNPLAINNCTGCGLPFTMDGTFGDTISGTNTWAVASLVLGIVGVAGGFCMVVPPVLAIIFGVIAMRGISKNGSSQGGYGLALAGIIMGALGILIFGLILAFPRMWR